MNPSPKAAGSLLFEAKDRMWAMTKSSSRNNEVLAITGMKSVP
jgi:hypothetical protein